jgi:hypothetical protein
VLPLLLLIASSVLGLSMLVGVVSVGSSPLDSGWYNDSSVIGAGGDENSTVYMQTGTAPISLNLSVGIIVLATTSIALVVASGVTILGSGLNSVSILGLFKGVAYLGLWGVFSATAVALFVMVPWFGMPLYFMLTLFYTLGIVQSVGFGVD